MTIRKPRLVRALGLVVVLVASLLVLSGWQSSTSDFALTSDHTAVSVEPSSQAAMALTIASIPPASTFAMA